MTVAYMPSHSLKSVFAKLIFVILGVRPSAGPTRKCFDSCFDVTAAAGEVNGEDIVAGFLRWSRAVRRAWFVSERGCVEVINVIGGLFGKTRSRYISEGGKTRFNIKL